LDLIETSFKDHISLAERTVKLLKSKIIEAVDLLALSFRNGGKVLLLGNGGSAADALHVEGELLGRFRKDRDSLPAIAIGGGIAAFTAIANDYSFESAFARLAKAHVRKGDVAMLYSTSGNSGNIIEAAKAVRTLDAKVVAFTGETGGKLAEYADILLSAPSSDTPRIQEMHGLMGHIICDMIEHELF